MLMTTTIQHPSPSSRHPRWEAIKRSFTQSNYITDFWNWLMTLMSKAAELVLFGSVLYSGYQLLPGITHAPAGVDALVFVIQQAALDIGGMGLLKLAKRAGLPKEAFPVRVGITLVILMILNVVLASLKQALPVIPAAVFVWIETVLLIARAVMAVLFGHAIHALREEYSESTITVKEASELREEIDTLASDLAQTRLHVQQQLAKLHEQLAQREQNLHEHLHESGALLARNLHDELASLRESLHMQMIEELASTMQTHSHAHANAHTHMQPGPSSVKPVQRQNERGKRGTLHALPQRGKLVDTGVTVRQFVFACLEQDATLKLAQINEQAFASGLRISLSQISRYRKAWSNAHANDADANATIIDANATMQTMQTVNE
jgi:uncharacterized membrane-anchored protein YhcB (DUF1043 family)